VQPRLPDQQRFGSLGGAGARVVSAERILTVSAVTGAEGAPGLVSVSPGAW
jgi:hypothetical protein